MVKMLFVLLALVVAAYAVRRYRSRSDTGVAPKARSARDVALVPIYLAFPALRTAGGIGGQLVRLIREEALSTGPSRSLAPSGVRVGLTVHELAVVEPRCDMLTIILSETILEEAEQKGRRLLSRRPWVEVVHDPAARPGWPTVASFFVADESDAHQRTPGVRHDQDVPSTGPVTIEPRVPQFAHLPADPSITRPHGDPLATARAVHRLVGNRGPQVLTRDTVLGRLGEGLARFDHPEVSRKHARIVLVGSAAYVEDLGSRNGTYVNGVEAPTSQQLENQDRIRLGISGPELVYLGP